MTSVLTRKLLRDVWPGLVLVTLLLLAFQCLWARVTERIHTIMKKFEALNVPRDILDKILFQENDAPGKIIEALMGGDTAVLTRAQDTLSIGYIHPLTQAILCIWAVGRVVGAVAGEIDRGTMELLLGQPVRRSALIVAHLSVDAITIPVLCLGMWGGTWLGAWLLGFIGNEQVYLRVEPIAFAPALLNVAALIFAVSGATIFLSSCGRFRYRVLGLAVFVFLVQFLINVVGQIWDAAAWLRPFTVFYYYRPQPMILRADWYEHLVIWGRLGTLLAVGTIGYILALSIFSRRDLPAPL
jgi:ABC-2 type transport system permease protein